MKIGDTVECINSNRVSIGIVGVITGFHENGKVLVLSGSGHEWMIRVDRLRWLNKEHSKSPDLIDESR